MLKDPILEAEFDALDTIDDEIDCAILNDEQFAASLSDIDTAESTAEEELADDDDDVVDVNVDYSEDIPSADQVDMDADDVIAAERDIMFDPFGDDEIIDTAIGGDIELPDDEEE